MDWFSKVDQINQYSQSPKFQIDLTCFTIEKQIYANDPWSGYFHKIEMPLKNVQGIEFPLSQFFSSESISKSKWKSWLSLTLTFSYIFLVSKTTKELLLEWNESHETPVIVAEDLKMPQFEMQKVTTNKCHETNHMGTLTLRHFLSKLELFFKKKFEMLRDLNFRKLQLPSGWISPASINWISLDSKLPTFNIDCSHFVGFILDGRGLCTSTSHSWSYYSLDGLFSSFW